MPSKQNVLPVIGALASALVWGLLWYPFRVLHELNVHGPLATLITFVLAMLCGIVLLRRNWYAEVARAGWWLPVLTLSAGWANFAYVLAMLHGEVMRVLLLFYLSPLWTVLLSYLLLNERLNRYGYMIIALSFGGAMVMLWKPQAGMPLPANFAEWLGLSAGMAFALGNVVSRCATHISIKIRSFAIWFGTAMLTAPLLWWQGGLATQLFAIEPYAWLLLGLLGVTLFATILTVQYAITHLPANRAIVLFLFQLVVAAGSSYVLAGEEMQLRDWIGALLIISATLLSGRLYEKNRES